jgi:hypothetical protein
MSKQLCVCVCVCVRGLSSNKCHTRTRFYEVRFLDNLKGCFLVSEQASTVRHTHHTHTHLHSENIHKVCDLQLNLFTQTFTKEIHSTVVCSLLYIWSDHLWKFEKFIWYYTRSSVYTSHRRRCKTSTDRTQTAVGGFIYRTDSLGSPLK